MFIPLSLVKHYNNYLWSSEDLTSNGDCLKPGPGIHSLLKHIATHDNIPVYQSFNGIYIKLGLIFVSLIVLNTVKLYDLNNLKLFWIDARYWYAFSLNAHGLSWFQTIPAFSSHFIIFCIMLFKNNDFWWKIDDDFLCPQLPCRSQGCSFKLKRWGCNRKTLLAVIESNKFQQIIKLG